MLKLSVLIWFSFTLFFSKLTCSRAMASAASDLANPTVCDLDSIPRLRMARSGLAVITPKPVTAIPCIEPMALDPIDKPDLALPVVPPIN